MKKNYSVEVDCAACAAKMENAAAKTEGVLSVNISFMAQKMTVEFAEGADEMTVMKNILKTCRKIERDCNIEF